MDDSGRSPHFIGIIVPYVPIHLRSTPRKLRGSSTVTGGGKPVVAFSGLAGENFVERERERQESE
jgi:hypothetical protein